MTNKNIFCSACNHSRYVVTAGKKKLYCMQREALGISPYLPTNATDARECLDFDPENRMNNLTTRNQYTHSLRKCQIPLEEEKFGLLADIKLD